ncbi:MAG: dienelactone hydrolase family protein [Aquabacterium sp.]|uniref:dienelactone hydrolase family protein n=1 Tax=Aquabacterium sp. TaxID=1872578 RepID=UPI001218C805|nr:dienelactone hydrolase family protein [Aquabacterium sp.]TAK93738.1 MAG: dienelactone hydrolase family protein [Aquabacterium sp.]
MGQMITFERPDGGVTQGYLVDAGAGTPCVILIQEWWGLNEHIRSLVDRMAAAGITTLAPDLYRGRLASSADEASHMMTGLDFADATHQDLRGAVQFLARRGGKVGVMGFCMGGALTVASAVHVPGLSAAVCFYGIPPAQFADPALIRIPFQGHFASKDDWCTPATVDGLEAAMTQAGQRPDIHRYEAHHAFVNQTRPEVYDAACATQAWDRTVDFLRQHLKA